MNEGSSRFTCDVHMCEINPEQHSESFENFTTV